METIDRQLLTFLVNALWQVPVAAGVAALACRLMRHSPAGHRHVVCVAGLIAAALLPVAGVRRSAPERPTIAVPQQIEIAASTAAAAPVRTPNLEPTRTLPVPRTAASLMTWAFGLFLLFQVVRLARAARATLALCDAAAPNSRDLPVWDRCRTIFGLRRAELRWSEGIDGPVAAGRTVILPASMANAPDDILFTALGHEAAHLARRDFAANLFCELLALPISFNPAAWWLRREIARTREMACDELVTTRLVAPEVYARSIVHIAGAAAGLVRPEYTLGILEGDILEERVRRLLHRPTLNLKRARLALAAGFTGLALCVAVASTLAISARAQSAGQQELRSGADAYNAGQFVDAVAHFEKAVAAEPDNVKARLFLAAAYIKRDATMPSEKAYEQYREVLNRDPKNLTAILGTVSVSGSKRAAESRDLLLKAIDANPASKEAYYTLGVVDWMIAYKPIFDKFGGGGPNIYKLVVADVWTRGGTDLRKELRPTVEEGLRVLQIALQKDPGWFEPMAYMNLLLRLEAALADNSADHDKYLAEADAWVGKAIAARKARSTSGNPADRIDADGPEPTSIPSMMIPAPPPPPPPPGGFRGNGDRKN